MSDRIVEEIRAVRQKTCEECDFNLEKLGEYYMQLQDKDPANLITEVPRTEPESATKAGP